jgi:hypothetical protein
MLQRFLSTYQRFAQWARHASWPRPTATLDVMSLEERAVPAAAVLAPVVPPQTVLVAPVVGAPVNVAAGSLAIPMAGQSMVRLEGGAGESTPEQADIWSDDGAQADVFARPPVQQPTAPPQAEAQDAAVSDEELAAIFAAQNAE